MLQITPLELQICAILGITLSILGIFIGIVLFSIIAGRIIENWRKPPDLPGARVKTL